MKNVYGNVLTVTLFGESHGPCVGAVLDGIAPGIKVDNDYIAHNLSLRAPHDTTATSRHEKDEFVIESGVYNGRTTGSPLCIIIPNSDVQSKNYSDIENIARPGHSDYPSYCKYHGYNDQRGGGHFSGRITAALVAVGAIVRYALETKNIYIGTHISECSGVIDRNFSDFVTDIEHLNSRYFPVLSPESEEKMKSAILDAKNSGNSVGGVLETVVIGMPQGVGEPWFDNIESMLSHGLFSIPGIKGVEFGGGFALSDKYGSEVNDPYRIVNGNVITESNNNGGIGGGITNGMPIIFRCAVKPTPSIAKKQKTVNFVTHENTEIEIAGRHDPCIAPRARAVVDAITALTLCDLLDMRYGTDWLSGGDNI